MRISEIQLLSDDLDATHHFYSHILGLKVSFQDKEKISFIAGTSTLTFIRSEKTSAVYHFAFNIPPHLLDEALHWVRLRCPILPVSNGEEIADFVSWNAKAFYFIDNNGNILEFIARYNLNIIIDGHFDSSCILSVSEIGIVTDDVVAERQKISHKYNIPIFSKPPLADNFTAMGDDHGLFILSKTARPWHPTHTEAQSYRSQISFESDGKELVIETK
jgi:catechol-2,3-dioxygenase